VERKLVNEIMIHIMEHNEKINFTYRVKDHVHDPTAERLLVCTRL
jgi:hypothetical protein